MGRGAPTMLNTTRPAAGAFAALSFTLLTAFACLPQEEDPPAGADQPFGPVPGGARTLAAAEIDLALGLHRALAESEDAGNIVLSPHSIWCALGMTREGARGATREEFDHLLGIPTLPKPRQAKHEIKALRLHLERAAGTDVALGLADMVWVRDGLDVSAETAADLRFAYGAEVRPLDFAADPAGARETINAWIAETTAGRIEEMLDANTITRDTELGLTDALHFKARWLTAFDPKATRERAFTLAGGESVDVPFMHLQRATPLPMGKLEDVKAGVSATLLEVPYEGERFSLCLVLPDQADGLGRVEAWLTEERLTAGLAEMKPREVRIALPKLKLEPRTQLVEPLKALGLRRAFDRKAADFGGFSREVPLVVNSVDHAVFLELDEEGTEAAAATAVTLWRGSAPREVAADRPFLFLVRERATGTPLAFGRVVDPR